MDDNFLTPRDENEFDRKTQQHIEEYGWTVMLIPEEEGLPSFGYTLGLFKTFNHPEIITFGLPIETTRLILNDVGLAVAQGNTIRPDIDYDDRFLESYPVRFKEVKPDYYPSYLGYAVWYYGGSNSYSALQLFWPDASRTFPWEEKFDPSFQGMQPFLFREKIFQFHQAPDLDVITTDQVLTKGLPILYVYHDLEGDWQFLCGTTDNPDDATLISLEKLVERDPSVNSLFDLQRGWMAYRSGVGEEWKRERMIDDESDGESIINSD